MISGQHSVGKGIYYCQRFLQIPIALFFYFPYVMLHPELSDDRLVSASNFLK